MRKTNTPLELSRLKTCAIHERESKVTIDHFAGVWEKGGTFSDFLGKLPDILAGRDLNAVIDAVSGAVRQKAAVCMGMGGHVIKVGLNPVLIDLVKRDILTMLSMNGAGIIHDLEIALAGKTSEDVAAALDQGTFGMARETSHFLNNAVQKASDEGKGLGRAVGELINEEKFPYRELSLTAACASFDIPLTVHVAIGTDIIHMHDGFDAAACGRASHIDFRIFAANIARLENGVFINAGSAVILPEVFLKALTLVRNMGFLTEHFTTVNLDFIRQYRPLTNVVNRPVQSGGKGYNLTGHHEILIPLIAAGVIEKTQ